jgi:Protein of unknown function (DUF4242)
MPLYLIERNFAEQINPTSDIAKAITDVNSGVGINWLFSFLSADKKKAYCLYEAPNPDAIRDAPRKLNLPADVIVELGTRGSVRNHSCSSRREEYNQDRKRRWRLLRVIAHPSIGFGETD